MRAVDDDASGEFYVEEDSDEDDQDGIGGEV